MFKKNLKLHLGDSLSMSIVANPVFSLIEMISGISIALSIKARIIGFFIPFLGISILIGRGRDLSRKIFKITEKTPEKWQVVHDAIFLACFHLLWVPFFYYVLIGARAFDEIAKATFGSLLYGFFAGGPVGYVIDIYRDLLGLKKCERKTYPKIIKRQSKKFKIIFAIELLIAEALLMAIIYWIFYFLKF